MLEHECASLTTNVHVESVFGSSRTKSVVKMNSNGKSLKRKICDAVEEFVDNVGNEQFRCLADIDADRRCMYTQKTFNQSNFKRHFLSCHPDVAKRLELGAIRDQTRKSVAKYGKLCVDISKCDVLLGTLKMATEHNLPIRFPEWEGVNILLGPLWRSCDLNITRNTIPTLVYRAAEIMRQNMSNEFRNKLVCLKIDATTRHSKSVLGINLTFTDDESNVKIMHLGKS